jgi:hypothetical protein
MTKINIYKPSSVRYERLDVDSLNDTFEVVNDAINNEYNDINYFFDNLLKY